MTTTTPTDKSIRACIISANTKAVSVANQCARMKYHKIIDHAIRVVSKNGLGQHKVSYFDIPRVPSLKMIKNLRSQHSGYNNVYYVSAVVSSCETTWEGGPMVNLKTGNEE